MRLRLALLVPLATLCALAASAPAVADPHLTHGQKAWISALVDRYTKDVILRENLADGWNISGPQMRGTTKKDFIAGNVPAQQLRLIGHSWVNTWDVREAIRNEYSLDVYYRVGHGNSAQMYDDTMVLDRIHGKWLVNALYTGAVFRLGHKHHGSCPTPNCAVTGARDFLPGSGPGNPTAPSKLGSGWLAYLVGGIVGVPLTALLGYLLYARSRNRRAWADYVNSKRV